MYVPGANFVYPGFSAGKLAPFPLGWATGVHTYVASMTTNRDPLAKLDILATRGRAKATGILQ